MELRCDARLYGIIEDNTLTVRCKSHWCGHKPGMIVLHRFDLTTGKVTTTKYKDPINRRKTGDSRHRIPVRDA